MTDHYYSPKPDSSLNLHKFQVQVCELNFDLWTASGVFSKAKLDRGTEVLIKYSEVKPKSSVLDLGCGIGTIGIALKLRDRSISVDSLDVNERAVMLAKKNYKLNKIQANVFVSDGFAKVDKKYDVILFNPPQSAGKKLCMNLIERSKEFLKKDGTLQVVVRHNKGGKTLSEHMKDIFGNVTELCKKSGYRVYLSRKEYDDLSN